ncbi:7-alpha-hydroxycholest-4-en-3-one 12-alpha-hydroxylase [Colletotrichum spinosum]|uniref:7-alpha-hydroxycholest-4-en-3-one 12-alpha-hydroxylase n=1 Tax=Colletotrichum spinosum TaxID=1347390 RepID=A0A4R8PPE6_9PEZI|nr:7-alpha-hydroxycholest-4-en-3-one 12-alpha-hydroxylase [Colletotrichum spinosum]
MWPNGESVVLVALQTAITATFVAAILFTTRGQTTARVAAVAVLAALSLGLHSTWLRLLTNPHWRAIAAPLVWIQLLSASELILAARASESDFRAPSASRRSRARLVVPMLWNLRRVGTSWAVKNTPAGPRQQSSRAGFVLRRAAAAILAYLLLDAMVSAPAPDVALVSVQKQTLWELRALTREDWVMRTIATASFWVSVALLLVVISYGGALFWGPDDIARCELALLHVATVNTAPILFWLIINIFSQQDLLKALRSECLPLMRREPSSGQEEKVTISIGSLQRSCPLLKACFQECLRIYGQPLHSRRVLSDTVLTDTQGEQYLLKKGVDVMMPSGVSHTMPDVWGSNAGQFDAARFMNWPDNASREQRAAYMPFGGGKHLCPGRNFATAEILGFVAALILGTDIEAPEGTANELTVPQPSSAVLGQAISKPRGYANCEGLGARIRKRVGFERVKWRFSS